MPSSTFFPLRRNSNKGVLIFPGCCLHLACRCGQATAATAIQEMSVQLRAEDAHRIRNPCHAAQCNWQSTPPRHPHRSPLKLPFQSLRPWPRLEKHDKNALSQHLFRATRSGKKTRITPATSIIQTYPGISKPAPEIDVPIPRKPEYVRGQASFCPTTIATALIGPNAGKVAAEPAQSAGNSKY